MIAPDILAEHALSRRLRQSDIDAFLSERVPPLSLARSVDGDFGFMARDAVVFDERGRYDPARYLRGTPDEVRGAYVLPVFDQCGDPADLLAFRPGGPAALWLGRVSMAGEEQVLRPRLCDPLDVHETVMGWLRAGRAGIVILSYPRAAGLLEGVTLQAASQQHARCLRTALARPAPPVVVRQVAVGVEERAA